MRILMIVATFVFATACAEAHDIYSGLKDHLGESSCCNETDCRPANYRVTAAGVEMLLDDEWVRMPNNVIQYRRLDGDSGETNGGHWCGVLGYELHPDHPSVPHLSPFYTRCVILPPLARYAGGTEPFGLQKRLGWACRLETPTVGLEASH